MKARIIIGSNNGDESKGTIVAQYTKNADGKVLNILTNGGAQRGHSILTDKGSFTFKHFGSGSSFGADNYFSEHFIINPMQFVKEYNELVKRDVKFTVYRNTKCRWTTPWDMMANQIIETKRGSEKHGSCGMGIWQTVKRCKEQEWPELDTFLSWGKEKQVFFLEGIRRLNERDTGVIPAEFREAWYSKTLVEHFLNDCAILKFGTYVVNSLADINGYDELIFENGQGLLLSDDGFDRFDRTPSKTGLEIPALILEQIGDIETSVHYVTRTYMTRHGKGFCQGELPTRKMLSSDVKEDRTNHWNEFQEDFRYGVLHLDSLKNRIDKDFSKNAKDNFIKIIEVTHSDELDREAEFRKVFGNCNFRGSALL